MTDLAVQVPSSDAFLDTTKIAVNRKTTYSSMNEWRDMSQQAALTHRGVPFTMTDSKWREMKALDSARRDNMGENAELEFRRAYSDLTSKIAYIHPNPGLPRIRHGRIGGTWRHIKEVLQNSGNRVVFVDGLVSVYDNEKFNHALQAELPHRPHIANPRYAPLSRDLDSYHQRDLSTMQTSGYVPSFHRSNTELPTIPTAGVVSSTDPDVLRKLNLQSNGKYKGVYRYK